MWEQVSVVWKTRSACTVIVEGVLERICCCDDSHGSRKGIGINVPSRITSHVRTCIKLYKATARKFWFFVSSLLILVVHQPGTALGGLPLHYLRFRHTMPSLRRTASTPAVRASPYSSSLLTARGNGHRRSSGSETSNRRVLADIDWWRVTEGQRHQSADQGMEDPNRGIQDIVSWSLDVPVIHVEAGVEHPVSMPRATADEPDSNEVRILLASLLFPCYSDCRPHWLMTTLFLQTFVIEPPTEQFSALAIAPHTPPRRHHTRESSSSLESTPQTPNTAFNFNVEVALEDATLPPLPVRRRSRCNIPIMKRSFTFADCLSLKEDYPCQYADFATSPLSSAPDFLNWKIYCGINTSGDEFSSSYSLSRLCSSVQIVFSSAKHVPRCQGSGVTSYITVPI